MAFYDSDDAFYGTGQYGAASYGVINPTVSLTGVSATALTRTLHINAFEVDITIRMRSQPAQYRRNPLPTDPNRKRVRESKF